MSKNDPKFEHFDYQGNGNIVRLRDALTPDGSDLRDEYDRRQLYCPFCHVARLTFVSKSTDMHGRVRKAHLVTKHASRSTPNDHADGCKGLVEHKPTETEAEHYIELTNEQIADRLAAEVRRYLRELESDPEIDMPGNEGTPPASPHGGNNNAIRRTLPRRSIYKLYNVEEELYGIPVLLYGDVRLRVIEAPSKYVGGHPFYRICILNKDTAKQIRSFYRAGNRDEIDEGLIYHIAMIVIYSYNDFGDMKCELYTQNSIEYFAINMI